MQGRLQSAPEWLRNPLFGLASMLVIGAFAGYGGYKTGEATIASRVSILETRIDYIERDLERVQNVYNSTAKFSRIIHHKGLERQVDAESNFAAALNFEEQQVANGGSRNSGGQPFDIVHLSAPSSPAPDSLSSVWRLAPPSILQASYQIAGLLDGAKRPAGFRATTRLRNQRPFLSEECHLRHLKPCLDHTKTADRDQGCSGQSGEWRLK